MTNLIFVALLNKVGVKRSFESNKIVMTVFLKKGYCEHRLFVLNIFEVMNNKISSSAYLIESYDIWHAGLGHVNSSYINIMQRLDMITLNNKQSG